MRCQIFPHILTVICLYSRSKSTLTLVLRSSFFASIDLIRALTQRSLKNQRMAGILQAARASFSIYRSGMLGLASASRSLEANILWPRPRPRCQIIPGPSMSRVLASASRVWPRRGRGRGDNNNNYDIIILNCCIYY